MTDLGTIGTLANLTKSRSSEQLTNTLRAVHCGADKQPLGVRNNIEGNPAQPSIQLTTRGKWRIRWIVEAGARTISVNVKQVINEAPRPIMTVKANPSIGVNADVVGTAPSGSGWVTIGPVNVNPSAKGALHVEFEARHPGQTVPTFFDSIGVT
jgi:hypothetical protein